MENKIDFIGIEPLILPLVEALNQTALVKTISSCEGHYEEIDQRPSGNRNYAYVSFYKLPNVPEPILELLLNYVVAGFYRISEFVGLEACKQFNVPTVNLDDWGEVYMVDLDDVDRENINVEPSYFIRLIPRYRFSEPSAKRLNTNEAISLTIRLITEWTKTCKLISNSTKKMK